MLLVKALLAEKNVRVLNTTIAERAAFRDIFDYGGTLEALDCQKVSNVEKAMENVRNFAYEVLRLMPVRVVRSDRDAKFLGRKAA